MTHDEALIDEVAKRCTEVESGARNVDNILTNTLLPGEFPGRFWSAWRKGRSWSRSTWRLATTACLCIANREIA